jgi:hypothetical protein
MTVTAESPRLSYEQSVAAPGATPSWSSMTPNRLRLVALGCAGLTVLVGILGFVAVSTRHASTSAAWETAEPLMIDAQAIDTSLSDADTTAAGSFLQGHLEPVSSHTRYLDDIAEASTTLATTTQHIGDDTAVATPLQAITVALPDYTGLVQTATFNQRQGNYPLAAAYMAEADNLMHARILPAAAQVYGAERTRLGAEQHRASGPWLVGTTVLLLIVLLVALFLVQRWMSRRFHRTINIALFLATLVMFAIGVWFSVAIVAQNIGVDSAAANGSRPVAIYTQARISALAMRADDELTLLSRDSVSSYQADETTTAASLQRLLASASVGASPAERTRLSEAMGALDGYRLAHDQIRRTDTQGDLVGAVSQASASGPTNLPAVSSRLDQGLAGDIAHSQQTFDGSMSGAAGDAGGLLWGFLVLSLVAAALIVVGVQPRIGEYR